MAYTVRVGSKVRYRTAAGVIKPATVTAVGASDVISLRIGGASNASIITTVSKRTGKGSTAGWVRGAR